MKSEYNVEKRGYSIFIDSLESKEFSSRLLVTMADMLAEKIFEGIPKKQMVKYFVRHERLRALVESKVADLVLNHIKLKLL